MLIGHPRLMTVDTSGYCVYAGSSLISWSSSKQRVVSRSSTEAEYRSLANAAAELTWFKHLFSELRLTLAATPNLWCDNFSAISVFKSHFPCAHQAHRNCFTFSETWSLGRSFSLDISLLNIKQHISSLSVFSQLGLMS